MAVDLREQAALQWFCGDLTITNGAATNEERETMATDTGGRSARPWPFISRMYRAHQNQTVTLHATADLSSLEDRALSLEDAMHQMVMTPTGRTPNPPEIQNFPGSPAASMEMLYARLGVPSKRPAR